MKLKPLFLKYKHALMLLYILIYLPWFFYLEKTVTTKFHVIHMPIDDKIPFCEFFIVPYLLWFFYIVIVGIYFFFADVNDYYRYLIYLFTGMTLFLLISTFYPNGHMLRPETFPRDNLFTDLVRALYETDTATNLFPSIHVYNSIVAHLAIAHSSKLKKHKPVQIVSLVLCISIILSTVFLKQHSVFDMITAFGLIVVLYPFFYGKKRKDSTSVQHTSAKFS